MFLPPNTTSKLQPLDLGIIQNFKVHYRHLLLRYVLSKIDECETATEIANSVNILIAMRWVAKAWEKVKEETISICFRKAGILDSSMDVISCDLEEDPFQDLDDDVDSAALQGLINQLHVPSNAGCSAQEYTIDEDLQTCQEMDDDKWEETMSLLGLNDTEQEQDDSEDDDAEQTEQFPSNQSKTSSITSYKDAINALEDIQLFLENKGQISTSIEHIGPAVDALVSLRTSSLTQPTMCDYFN